MSETETALATVENQLRATPKEINLYVDDRASARISQAELELKQLLAKYLPTSDPGYSPNPLWGPDGIQGNEDDIII